MMLGVISVRWSADALRVIPTHVQTHACVYYNSDTQARQWSEICSVLFCSVLVRSVRSGSVRFGSVRFGSVRFGYIMLCSIQVGSVQFG